MLVLQLSLVVPVIVGMGVGVPTRPVSKIDAANDDATAAATFAAIRSRCTFLSLVYKTKVLAPTYTVGPASV